MPKVSVIVPVYNVEKYIKQCVDSLINQTLTDIEIILIDDESPDNCGKICDEYAKNDNRIKVIHKKNGGVSAARNDGMKVATADWIMFVDSDDWCDLTMCQVAYENAVKNDADIAIFNHYNNYEKKEEINKTSITELILSQHEEIEKLQMTILHNRYKLLDNKLSYYPDLGAPWSKIFRKQLIIENEIKFDLALKGVFDDVFFCINSLEKATKVTYQNIPLYHYRRLNNSMITKFKKEKLDIYNNIADKFNQFIVDNNKSEAFIEAYYIRIVLNLCKLLKVYFFHKSNGKKLRENLKELKQTINTYPYNQAIKKVNLDYLSKTQKMYTIFFRKNNLLCVWIFYKIKKIQQRIRKEV